MSDSPDWIEQIVRQRCAAQDAEIAALQAALEFEHEETTRLRGIIASLRGLSASPAPDPAEALRAENELMMKLLEDIRNNAWPGKALGRRIDEVISRAALKGNGEG